MHTKLHCSSGSSQRALLVRKRFTEAFELAISAYGDRMLGLAFSILRDRAEAEDAVQDVMVRIWRALPQFRGDSAISTWIYTVTRNRCLTMLKQRSPRGGWRKCASVLRPTYRWVASQDCLNGSTSPPPARFVPSGMDWRGREA